MAEIYKRNCDNCGKSYKGYGKHYCSQSCRMQIDGAKYQKLAAESRRKGIYKKCIYCGKEFYVHPSEKDTRKFCSQTCSNKANAKKQSKARMGDGNPMYGKRPWNYIDGKRVHYYAKGKWRRFAAKIRNGNKCKICNSMKSLIVHHIISRRSGGRDNVENLMVLCRKCHNRLHAEMAIGGGVE